MSPMARVPRGLVCGFALVLVLGLSAHPVTAIPLDTPQLELIAGGSGKQSITVTAGASGAPAGFTVWWTTQAGYEANGELWSPSDPYFCEGVFWGEPTLNVFPDESPNFQLAPGASITIELGDLYDETGVTSTWTGDLSSDVTFVITAFANASEEFEASEPALALEGTTVSSTNCTYTVGFWKTHPTEWPTDHLYLGAVSYTQAELLDILNEPARGNGLLSLAHQLIAAKLSISNGADPSAISSVIATADGLIGNLVVPPIGEGNLPPSGTSNLTQGLDDFNNGIAGPGHCQTSASEPSSWGSQKIQYR